MLNHLNNRAEPDVKNRRSGGFTLIELLVVIGIIILLTGITVSVSMAVVQRAEAQRTRQTLTLLDQAVQEWERSADRQLTWWADQDPQSQWNRFDIHSDTPESLIITELLDVIRHNSAVQSILSQINEEFMYTYNAGEYPAWIQSAEAQSQVDSRFDGSMTVLDAWGVPIYATHPGRPWRLTDNQYTKDSDGTIRTYNEDVYGIAQSRNVCFVSAGPDQRFGLMHMPHDTEAFKATQDNVFSYEPIRPEPYPTP